MLTPYRYALKRRVIKGLMDNHSYTRQQARAAWAKVTDEHIEQANKENGVSLIGFDFNTIIQWISENWTTIAKVALSILGIILMFVEQPPNATNLPVKQPCSNDSVNESEKSTFGP